MSETNVSLIPSEVGSIAEQSGKLAEAVTEVNTLGDQLIPLEAEERALEVKYPDRAAYQRVGQILSAERGVRKQLEASVVARLASALQILTRRHTNACEMLDARCKAKMKTWERAELDATAAEQKQQDEQAAKAGEEAPKVQHNIPPVADYRRSKVYRAERVDEAKFWRKFFKDPKYLKRFVYIDDQEIRRVFREEVKDPAKMAEMVPGYTFKVE